MSGQIQYGPGDLATCVQTHALVPEDQCHFMTPVRFGRRKTDQVGHLALTSNWLNFRGTVELSIAWGDVSHVESAAEQLIVALHGTRRTLRFCCGGSNEAQRGSVIGSHLAALAQADACHSV